MDKKISKPASPDNKRIAETTTLTNGKMASHIEELEKANKEIFASRRAALNALEDAILSKEALRKSEEKLARELEYSKQLQFISNKIIEEENIDKLFLALVEAAMQLMHADIGSIQLLDAETNLLTLKACKNFHPRSAEFWQTVAAGSGSVCGEALRNNSRITVNDIEQEDFAKNELNIFRLSGIRAVQSTPMISSSGKLTGRLNTQWKQPRNFSAEDFRFFDVLVRQAADLIERKRTEAALRESEERKAFLLKLNDTIRHLTNPEEIQYEAARLVAEQLQADRVHFAEVNDDKLIIRKDYVRGDAPSIAGVIEKKEIVVAVKLEQDEPVIIYDVEAFPLLTDEEKEVLAAAKIRSQLSVALSKEGKKVAGFSVDHTTPREWKPLEVSILQEAAERTWAAVEKANAEEALRESEIKLRELNNQLEEKVKERTEELQIQKDFSETIVNTSPDLITAFDNEKRIIGFNKACEDFFHIKKEDVLGKFLTDAFPKSKDTQADSDLTTVIKTGEPIHNAVYHSPVTGRYYENFIIPLKDKLEKVYAVIVVAHDNTELINSVENLKASEEKFYNLFNFSPVCKTLSEASEGKIIMVNDAFINTFGYSHDEVINKTSNEIGMLSDEQRQIIFSELKAKGKLVNKEIEFTKKSGEKFIALASADRIKINNSPYFIGAYININDRKKAEEMIEQKNTELQTMNKDLQQANQQVAISTYNKRFLTEFSEKFSTYKVHDEFFNSLVLFIADLTKIDYVLVGRLEKNGQQETIQTIAITAFGKLADNINYPLPDGPCEEVVRGKLYSYPENCRTSFPKNQTLIQFNVEGYIGYPLFDAQGNVIGLIAAMHETKIEDIETVASFLKITAKRAEVEMERIRYEVQLENNNKTLEQKNAELANMNKELEAFTYISSHDLQEPLRKMQTFAGRILEKENQNLSEKGKEMFHRMQEASSRMQMLIQDLLAFSKLNSTERKFEITDLNKLVVEVKNELSEIIKEKNATVEVTDLCEAYIIPFQFRQLMQNLLSNALKFSKPGLTPHIVIKDEIANGDELDNPKLLPDKKYCHITFTDNGIGFDSQFSEKIFEVFQKLHGKEKYAGTGIGLAIAKKIMENHNGDITAQSELGKGAKFDIYLPA